jgi:hypothetical protein
MLRCLDPYLGPEVRGAASGRPPADQLSAGRRRPERIEFVIRSDRLPLVRLL